MQLRHVKTQRRSLSGASSHATERCGQSNRQELPWVKVSPIHLNKRSEFRFRALEIVPGILRLVERVPDELFVVLNSEDMTRFVLAETALREAVALARNNLNSFDWPRLSDNTDCVAAIRSVLQKCPDQVPSESIV